MSIEIGIYNGHAAKRDGVVEAEMHKEDCKRGKCAERLTLRPGAPVGISQCPGFEWWPPQRLASGPHG
eukprot:scaffold334768_cov39-Prasinocladus_malaysianus.AAC.1